MFFFEQYEVLIDLLNLIFVIAETKWQLPKSGFISLDDQKELGVGDIPGDQTSTTENGNTKTSSNSSRTFKHEQFGRWQTVANADSSIDLQLPERRPAPVKRTSAWKESEEQLEFKEKTATNVSKGKKKVEFGFKKRKNVDTGKRNLRQRTDDE